VVAWFGGALVYFFPLLVATGDIGARGSIVAVNLTNQVRHDSEHAIVRIARVARVVTLKSLQVLQIVSLNLNKV